MESPGPVQGLLYLAFILFFDSHLPEDGHCRPELIAGVSPIHKLLYIYRCAFVGMNIVNISLLLYYTITDWRKRTNISSEKQKMLTRNTARFRK